MIHFPGRKELWRTRRLSWQKAESVGGLRLLETGGVSRGCNGHDAAFSSGEVFVSFCPVCKSETSLLPAPSCPGSLLLSVFSQWSHAPVSFLCLYVLGVKHRAPRAPMAQLHTLLATTCCQPDFQVTLLQREDSYSRLCGHCNQKEQVWNAVMMSLRYDWGWPIVSLAMPKPGGMGGIKCDLSLVDFYKLVSFSVWAALRIP